MNFRRNTLRSGLLLGAAFLAGVALLPTINQITAHSSAAVAKDLVPADAHRLLNLFGHAFEQARQNYVDPVSDKDLIENALNGMLSGLDPHSAYIKADAFEDMRVETSGEFGGIGVEVLPDGGFIRVISPMNDTPASQAGIKAGDLIVALDHEPIQGLPLESVARRMRGPPNTETTLTIKREGTDHPLEFRLRREIIHIQVVKYRLEPDNIGYVRLTEFTEPADAAVKQAVESLTQQAGGDLNALVLDLRNNPGGLLDQAVAVAGTFVGARQIVSVRARHTEDDEWLSAEGKDVLGGAPLVILINNGSSSASEIVAGALQDYRRALLLGSRTFGKGSVQTVIPLENDSAIRLTTARYYTPSGRSIQGKGIVPDVRVEETREEMSRFEPEHEADLNHSLKGSDGVRTGNVVRRTDLPRIARTIPSRPPKDFPEFDPGRPEETDFQLRQALAIAKAMGREQ